MSKLLILILLSWTVNITAQPNSNSTTLKQSIQQLENQWCKAYINKDTTTLINMYTDDAVSMPPEMPMMKGKDEIAKGTKMDFNSGIKYTSFIANTIEVYETGNVAYEVGTYKSVFIPAHMKYEISDHGKYLDIWQKQSDGSWKIKYDIWNSDVPPMPMMQSAPQQQ